MGSSQLQGPFLEAQLVPEALAVQEHRDEALIQEPAAAPAVPEGEDDRKHPLDPEAQEQRQLAVRQLAPQPEGRLRYPLPAQEDQGDLEDPGCWQAQEQLTRRG